jgi:hypothetical protein
MVGPDKRYIVTTTYDRLNSRCTCEVKYPGGGTDAANPADLVGDAIGEVIRGPNESDEQLAAKWGRLVGLDIAQRHGKRPMEDPDIVYFFKKLS